MECLKYFRRQVTLISEATISTNESLTGLLMISSQRKGLIYSQTNKRFSV